MENELVALSNELAATVEQTGHSVVAVHGRPRLSSSGIVWRPGVIVTADHTLRRDEGIRITGANGNTVAAEIAGRDSGTDLAVLKADVDGAPAVAARTGNPIQSGNLMLVVGRSQDTGVTATLGVISSVSGPWHTWRGGKVDQFIRLDAGVYPGASGGAVVDASGGWIGLATLGLSRTSALAIPAATIERVASALLDKGHVSRGYLGVGLQPVPLPRHLGVDAKSALIVLSVEPDSPSAKAGVVIGDVFLALDGKSASDTDDVQALLGPEYVGKTVQASILRGGARIELPITIGERPQRRC